MGEILNLRQARKRADRRRSEAAAVSNRIAFGTPRILKDEARRERTRSAATLDAHRIEKPAPHPLEDASRRCGPVQEAEIAGGSQARAGQAEGLQPGTGDAPDGKA